MELVNESSEEDLDRFILDEEDIVVSAREFLVEKVDPRKQKVSVSCNDTLEPSRIINTSTEELLEYSNCCTLYTDIVNDIMDTLDETNISVNSPCRSIMSELDVPPDVVPTLEVNENEHHAEEPLNEDSPSVHQDQFSFPENNNFGYVEGADRHDAKDLNSGQRDPDFDPNIDCNADSSGLITVSENNSVVGDVIEVRMRKSKGQGVKRKREQAKTHREKGEAYLGYHRERSTGNGSVHRMIQDNPRNPKVMGPPCDSVKCKKWATRSCETVSETDRHKLFTSFWKDMSWDSKKMFICSLVDIKQTNISTVKERVGEATTSRRHSTLAYYLKIGNRKVQVCKKMFLQTFGLGEMSVRHWLKNYREYNVPSQNKVISVSGQRETYNDEEEFSGVQWGNLGAGRRRGKVQQAEYLKQFLTMIPKLPSHYIRKDSKKLYLEVDIQSVAELFRLYTEKCKEDGIDPLSRFSFDKTYKQLNIGIFRPRKDQCDICCGFRTGNISAAVNERHLRLKDQAREKKQKDKQLAIDGVIHTITCDMMAVQLLPSLKASSSYYKLKLHTHNYTVFNLGNHDVKCYWWDESVGSLDATIYASCLVNYIEELMHAPDGKKNVVIYTDGCSAQNRNSVLSNALLHSSIKHGITITQKILEKGHTQMEVDSVHSHIERKIGSTEIYLPYQYVQKTVTARIDGPPYRAIYLEHDFFLDYGVEEKMIYPSIRPGSVKNDPTVLDLRWIQYEPHGQIKYKLYYNEELQALPRRPHKEKMKDHNFPKLYSHKRIIPLDKYNDLNFLADKLLPGECKSYYEGLPHAEISIRKEKKSKKK